MATIRHLRFSSGKGDDKGRETEKEPLDQLLADPGLIHSLRQEEHRRRLWLLAVAALCLGLLLGGGAVWWVHRERPRAALKKPAAATLPVKADGPSSEELARILTANGLALAKAKEIHTAWAYLRLATELSPTFVEAWDALALAYFYGGQVDEAERAFRRCTEIDPGYLRGYHATGDLYFYTGDYRKAEQFWLKAGATRPLARVRLLEGRFAEAAPLVKELEEKTPDQWFVRVMVEAVRAGQLTPEMRLQLEPGFVGSRSPETARGWRLYFAERYDEASEVFGRVLARDSRDGSARLGEGWCRLKTSAPQEAQADFELVLKTWPSNYSALNGLGWSLKEQNQAPAAAAAWKRVLNLRPESPETPESLKGLGMVSFEQGDAGQASRYLTEALLQNPFDPETRTVLEDALEQLPQSTIQQVKP